MLVLVIASPSAAIGQDNGWTQQFNSGYPGASSNPECQTNGGGEGCVGWNKDYSHNHEWPDVNYGTPSGWPSSSMFYYEADNAVNHYINPLAPNGGVASLDSPYYGRNNYGGFVGVGATDLSSEGAVCAETTLQALPQAAINHGCCQSVTITGATINLNTQRYFDNTGDFSNGRCELRNVYGREFGLTLGLAETRRFPEMQYYLISAVYTAQPGDQHGVSCMYDLQNCN
jgi:hypothetical protein